MAMPQAMPPKQCTDGRTNERSLLPFRKKLTLRNARDEQKKSPKMRKDPKTVPCQYCGADKNEPCRNKARDNTPPLEKAPAHPVRLRDAEWHLPDIDDWGELF